MSQLRLRAAQEARDPLRAGVRQPPSLNSAAPRGDARPAGAVLVTLALALSGCASAAPGTETGAPTASTAPSETTAPTAEGQLPAGVVLQLRQLRSDVAARQAQVEVRNDGDDDLTITQLTVADPRFAEPAVRVHDRASRVPAGATVDLRVQLPPMDCDAAAGGRSTAHVVFSTGGAPVRAEAPIADPLGFLSPLHDRECRAEAVADAAHLAFASFTPSPPGQPADLVLEIAPTGEGAVRVVGVQTTNLLSFAGSAGSAEAFPIGLDVGAGEAVPTAIHLPLVPFRCDPHAVQEDKRGTIFAVEVEVDGEPGEVDLAASEDLRGRILTWVANWCGFGPG